MLVLPFSDAGTVYRTISQSHPFLFLMLVGLHYPSVVVAAGCRNVSGGFDKEIGY